MCAQNFFETVINNLYFHSSSLIINLVHILILFFLSKAKAKELTGVKLEDDPESNDPAAHTMHHIIPNNEIKEFIPRKTDPRSDAIQKVQDYVNLPHIKEIIIQENMTNPELNHGDVIHGAIANNPHNLADGARDRIDDPRGGIDKKILGAQSKDYQTAVEEYQTAKKEYETAKKEYAKDQRFKKFGKLPPPKPVEWQRNASQGNNFEVKRQQN